MLYRSETEIAQSMFNGFLIRQVKDVRSVVRFIWDLEYKGLSTDWRSTIKGPEETGRSIYVGATR